MHGVCGMVGTPSKPTQLKPKEHPQSIFFHFCSRQPAPSWGFHVHQGTLARVRPVQGKPTLLLSFHFSGQFFPLVVFRLSLLPPWEFIIFLSSFPGQSEGSPF